MGNITDNYESYIEHIAKASDKEIRADIMIQIKRNMIKRSVIKVAEMIIFTMGILGIVPSFLG